MYNCYSINPNVREGLLEVFYGVYEKDPDKVIHFSLFVVVYNCCWILGFSVEQGDLLGSCILSLLFYL